MEALMKKGFTLAEVLITLGIIGVVAAMTIPTLVQKYKKHVYYTQFRKAATQLEQALRLYQIDHGCEGDISACGTPRSNGFLCLPVDIPNFVEDFAKYFNGAQLINDDNADELCSYEKIPVKGAGYDSYCINDAFLDGNYAFKTPDGAFYTFGLDEGVGSGSIVDINGPDKGPNEVGRDIFVFYLHYVKDMPVTYSGIVWGGNYYSYELCDDNDINNRYGCAARLMREGKMNY